MFKCVTCVREGLFIITFKPHNIDQITDATIDNLVPVHSTQIVPVLEFFKSCGDWSQQSVVVLSCEYPLCEFFFCFFSKLFINKLLVQI